VAQGSRLLYVPAVARQPVIDPTGAGNAYGGAFLASWCESGGDLEHASCLAAAVGGLVVGERGPLRRNDTSPKVEVTQLAHTVNLVDLSSRVAASAAHEARFAREGPG
jgi:sugar/nucleoside kinase (ribokinase family)